MSKETDMTVQEFYSGFDLSFLTEVEAQTIYTATELYAKGKLRQFTPSEGVEQAAKEYADRVMPFVWPLNKQGEEIVMRVGQSQPPFSKKHRKEQDKIIAAFLAGASYRPDNQPRN